MKTVAIIQARMGSRRFPGKVLADLRGKPVLKHVIDRVRLCREVDLVAVATSTFDEWRPIGGACEEWMCEHTAFVVPVEDVLGRYVQAAIQWKANLIVRVCGDNPLIHPGCIDQLVVAAKRAGADYVGYAGEDGRPIMQRATGYFAEVVTADMLRRADEYTPDDDSQRQHATGVIYAAEMQSLAQNKLRWLCLPEWYRNNQPPDAAIDTPEDLERVAKMMGEANDRLAD